MPESNQIPEVHKDRTKLKRKMPSKNVLLAAVWVLVLLIIGVASFTVSRNNVLAANRPAEQALAALKANDPNAIYELGTDEFKKASDKKQVQSVVEQWSKVIAQATDGKPQLVRKNVVLKDGKELTTLDYKYQVQPGKSKVNQKELYIRAVTQKVENTYKLSIFSIDITANQNK